MSTERNEEIRALAEQGLTQAKIAERFGISRGRVSQIIGDSVSKDGRYAAWKQEIEDCIAKGAVRRTDVEQMLGRDISRRLRRLKEVGMEIKFPDWGTQEESSLTGQQFGLWTVLDRAYKQPDGSWSSKRSPDQQSVHYFCRCQCGVMKPVRKYHLLYGKSSSCYDCASKNPYQYKH